MRVPFPMRVFAGIAAVVTVVVVVSPSSLDRLTVEDGPIEWATAGVLLGAGIIALTRRRAPRWPYITAGSVALLSFLDEISFGARLFGFGPLRFRGMDVDSLHDLFDVVDRMAADVGLRRIHLLAMAIVIASLVASILLTGGRRAVLERLVREHPVLLWTGGALAAMVLAIGLDLVSSAPPSRFAEEMLELGAGFALLTGALATPRERVSPAVRLGAYQ